MTSGMTQNEKSPVSPHDHTMSIAVNVAIPLKTDVVVLQPSGDSRSEKQASQYENTRTIQPRTGSPNRVKDTDLLVEHGRSHDSESFPHRRELNKWHPPLKTTKHSTYWISTNLHHNS